MLLSHQCTHSSHEQRCKLHGDALPSCQNVKLKQNVKLNFLYGTINEDQEMAHFPLPIGRSVGKKKPKFTPPANQTVPCRRSPNQPPSKPAMNGTRPTARRFTTVKLPEMRSAISTATAAEMPGSRIVRPADLSPTMKPPMAKARKLSTAASTICPPRSSTSSGLATPLSCGARKSPRIRPAIKLSTTITTTPMPIHFQFKVPVISSSFW